MTLPTPDYERDGITMYCGDCLELLPLFEDKSVDAVVTDPPYGVEGGKGGQARKAKKAKYVHTGWNDTEEYVIKVAVASIEYLIGKVNSIAVTTGNRCLHYYPKPTDIGCFWTPAASNRGAWGFTTFNPILYYGKDWRSGKGPLPSGTKVTERSKKNGHPCPKPIKAWTWLVDKASPVGTTILDPFMGSGTTGVACIRTGRKFIGIEKEPKYFDIAVKRIEDEFEKTALLDGVA